MKSTVTLVRIALFGAILFISQISLSSIPNGELVTTLLIVITLSFPDEAYGASVVFCLLETILYGFGTWSISYFYVWPSLVFMVKRLKPIFKENFFWWTLLSAFYGMIFGPLFALLYVPFDFHYALIYWINGIKFDLIHCFFNILITSSLGKPLYVTLKKLNKNE